MGGVVLLAGPGSSTWIMANALAREHADLTVLIEEPEPRAAFLRRRARHLGIVTAFGQVLFVLWSRWAARRARVRTRISEIHAGAALDETPVTGARVHRIGSANSSEARAAIAESAPEVVVVNGTRILSHTLLAAVEMPVLNLHAGITPYYRGVHGGYWALAGSDPERCGASVHLVDAGVDTGAIVAQARISPGADDTFLTYPALQLAAGVPLMLEAVRQARAGTLESTPSSEPGRQFYHPTLWGYWVTGLTRGVW